MIRLRSWAALLLAPSVLAAPRQHTVFFGKWRPIKVVADSGEPRELKVRELVVDGRSRESTAGLGHDVTDRVFVVRRVYRLNDSLSEEPPKVPQWVWRLGGWISVDRLTGHVTQLNLPDFDPELSEAAWYRDYAAYCGASDDGGKMYLMVWQLGRRKPVLRREFAGPNCAAPEWERNPTRVTFNAAGEKNTFLVHARAADQSQGDTDE